MINLDDLNPIQKEAVSYLDGPLLILAGAGSGKTKVLTYKIAYILDSGLAGLDNILAVTFTNKAAGEMKERINKLLRLSSNLKNSSIEHMPWVGTFHSICVKILKRYGENIGLNKNFTIYDSSDQKEAIKDAMKALDISVKEFNPGAIHSYISSAKNELITPEEYGEFAQGYFQSIVAKVYPQYQKILKDNNAVDFDDLLLLTARLLKENNVILQYFTENFRYILVDEYQDTNHAQYTLIKMLASKHRNIYVVGDDDQSIYAFRGANIRNILNFEKDYPEAKVVKLEQNYRSTKLILEASHQVISKNRNRKEKKLWTENNEGEKIKVFSAEDEQKEGVWITGKIAELGSKYNLNNIAVLYRTNAQSRVLEEAFINAGIPYRIVGSVGFYERKEIKDILAYLRVIFNSKDNKNLERVINVPKRGIGKKTFEELLSVATEKNLSIVEYLNIYRKELDSPGLKLAADLFSNLVALKTSLPLLELIDLILKSTKYIEMLSDGTLENESRIENIKELLSVAVRFNDLPPEEALEQFLDEVSLLEAVSVNRDTTVAVTLMTIHSAKGLEFEHVFVTGMEENLFPHINSVTSEDELEEERRLAYVALTRAKNMLYLSYAQRRRYFGSTQLNPVSRFLRDIESELLDEEIKRYDYNVVDDYEETKKFTELISKYKVGDRVKHEYFGKGTVKKIDSEIIIVDFGAVYGKKELMLEYARLEKI